MVSAQHASPAPQASDSSLSLTGRYWQLPEPLEAGGNDMALAPWLRGMLAKRGITEPAAVQRYLEPSLAQLPDPASMADMAVATERLLRAIPAGEAIVVWGDYDVDGVSSATVVVDFLRRVGANVDYYIPDRRAEGYGLNEAGVRSICERAAILITTDCGITAVHEIKVARSLGVDVIVVDHHQVPPELPPSLANLNPQRADCDFPDKGLCATGVAFMLVASLRRAMREAGMFSPLSPEPDLRELLDVVAVATVADMVPLVGVNRMLVATGLRQMGRTRRLGMLALLQVSEVEPARVTATDLGFRIGPRINARGRMGQAREAVELLLTTDAKRAGALADELDAANRERREVEKQTLAAAIEQVEQQRLTDHAAIVAYGPSWHPGVLGLVATRLVSHFRRPAFVIGEGGKGSGRSVAKLDLVGALHRCSELLLKYGGHAAAAGLTIEAAQIDAFRRAFGQAVESELGAPPYVPTLKPDLEIDGESLNLAMVADMQRLAPFGQHNPEPLLVARNLKIQQVRIVGDDHLKLTLGDAKHDAIAFRMGNLAQQLPERVDAAFRLERNEFRGRVTLQLRIEDLRAARLPS